MARIITRSHQYSQQLALDLLARGYAVEIVSPDAVPSNPADLELRVEAGGAEAQGQVTEIREGKQARSLEYLQRLKPMMTDLLRRWPSVQKSTTGGTDESTTFRFNGEHEYSDEMEMPASGEQRPTMPIQPELGPIAEEPECESARLISRTAAPKLESAFSITGEPLVWAESQEELGDGSEVWFWRAAVGFAAMALVILVFGMALRRNPAVPLNPASMAPVQTASVKIQPTAAKPTTLPPSASLSTIPAKPAVIATAGPTTSSVNKPKPSAAMRRTRETHLQEVVNGDTTVTYFNAKREPPKQVTATQESGIKHYSDLN